MLKVVAYAAPVVTLAAVVVLGLTGSFTTGSPLAVALYLTALGLAVWARVSFPLGAFRGGPSPAATGVITNGPYRYVRHPMYSAALLLIWTASLVHLEWWTVAIAVVVTATAAGRMVWEERLLRSALSGYAEYAASTRAIIPFVL